MNSPEIFRSVSQLIDFAGQQPTSVLLDTARPDRENYWTYLFYAPRDIICGQTAQQLSGAFQKIEQATAAGYYVAGFIGYEAGHGLLPKLPPERNGLLPLLWFGVFDRPIRINLRRYPEFSATAGSIADYQIRRAQLSTGRRDYCRTVRRIQDLIAAGDTYQINYTIPYRFALTGSVSGLYRQLRLMQPTPYAAWVRTPEWQILSFSPELFFRRQGRNLLVRPMKGTAGRGQNAREDRRLRRWLQSDEKNRAENVMIVDLLRNDLGRIAQPGSVSVTELCRIEQHPTVLQMTSTVTARIRSALSWQELFTALFPSGSVTGAPKIRSMQIIRDIEPASRGAYTGAIGFISPRGVHGVFNVAIRTLSLNQNTGEFWVGSGITAASKPADEFEECRMKAGFLLSGNFRLIETMRADRTGIALLDEHLRRLHRSARRFRFPCRLAEITRRINSACKRLPTAPGAHRMRLLLSGDGTLRIETAPLTELPLPARITLSSTRVHSSELFLQHKTTYRPQYEPAMRRCRRNGWFDIIFRNERNEITEGAISTVFIKKGRYLYTPPVSVGALPGVYRAHLMATRGNIREKIITVEEMERADAIYCTNAVRGMVPVQLVRS